MKELIGCHLPTLLRQILELEVLHRKRVRLKKRNGLQKKMHFVIQLVFLIKKQFYHSKNKDIPRISLVVGLPGFEPESVRPKRTSIDQTNPQAL